MNLHYSLAEVAESIRLEVKKTLLRQRMSSGDAWCGSEHIVAKFLSCSGHDANGKPIRDPLAWARVSATNWGRAEIRSSLKDLHHRAAVNVEALDQDPRSARAGASPDAQLLAREFKQFVHKLNRVIRKELNDLVPNETERTAVLDYELRIGATGDELAASLGKPSADAAYSYRWRLIRRLRKRVLDRLSAAEREYLDDILH